jgi:hypothetical protein
MISRSDVGVIAVGTLSYGALLASIILFDRRAKERICQEKMAGRLPTRRSPAPPRTPRNPALTATVVLLWAFVPVIAWFLCSTLMRLLTPLSAREYLPSIPPLSVAIGWNLIWWLFWPGLALFAWVAARVGDWLTRRFSDPAVAQAEELIKVGDLDGAVCALGQAIDAGGPTVARWNALADALMRQERWAEALKVSLDIEDRRRLDLGNRRRKALALCQLGLPEVALLEMNLSNTSQRLPEVCSYCQALIDLGLYDRAWDQLRRAEVLYSRGIMPRDEIPRVREQIDNCRARLAKHFADKKADGFDEL